MTGDQLKKSILQYAIEGKLVPQDDKEESASELVKKIRAEKERLIKEKVIKKDKNESYIYRKDGSFYEKIGKVERCIDDEIPFDIPDSWEWARLGSLINFKIGRTPKRADNDFWDPGVYPWVSISDMVSDGVILETKEKISEKAYQKVFGGNISKKGTLLMSFKLSIGKVSILDIDAFHNEAIISIYTLSDEKNNFKNYLMKILPLISESGNSKSAIKGKTLNSESIKQLLIPVPPLAEQKRIVAKIEELLPFVEKYNLANEELNNINKLLPKQLKKSVLQYAIQGKLVEQNDKEEPASELVKKIKAEKERLIKDKVIKKDKNESYIYRKDGSFYEKIGKEEICIDDEIPFDIPDSWEWARLGNVFDIRNGFTPLKSNNKFWENGTIPWFTVSDVRNQGEYIYYTEQKISKICVNEERMIPKESILLCCTASIGTVALTKIDLTSNQQFNGLSRKIYIGNNVDINFYFYFCKTLKQKLLNLAGVTTFPFVSVAKLKNVLIPIPPLAEQKRIVAKIEEILDKVEELKSSI